MEAIDAELPRTAGLASCTVGTTLDQANLNTSVFAESGGTHTYADLDRFNRPTRWNWERVGGASGGFYNTAIAYDENSNPVSTTDAAPGPQQHGQPRCWSIAERLPGCFRCARTPSATFSAGESCARFASGTVSSSPP